MSEIDNNLPISPPRMPPSDECVLQTKLNDNLTNNENAIISKEFSDKNNMKKNSKENLNLKTSEQSKNTINDENNLITFGNPRSNIGKSKQKSKENNENKLNSDNLNGSLQNCFENFRKKKIEALKAKSKLKEKADLQRKDPKFMEKLREKFIERAKHYFGIPYKRKYHEEGTELYNSPLF